MASRDLTAGMLSEIQAGHLRPILLYEGEFADGSEVTQYLRLWTGIGALSWDSKTWTGGGELLSISAIQESTGVKAVGFSVTFTGAKSANVSLALQSIRRNRPGTLWLGALDSSGAVVADPYKLKKGRFDRLEIDDPGETCSITAFYEDRLMALNVPRERRYTHEDQQLRSAGDLGFEYVEALQDAVFGL